MKSGYFSRFGLLLVLLLSLSAAIVLTACAGAPAPSSSIAPDETPVPTQTPASTVAPTQEATVQSSIEAPPGNQDADTQLSPADNAANAGLATFVIVPEESEVRFIVAEVLFGDAKTVIGRTSEVTGEIAVDPKTPSNSQIGPITVNVRSLVTDSSFRNRALRRTILQSNKDEYQFVVFRPVSIAGLPDTVAVGDTVTFDVTGDLTVRDITKPVTFAMTVTVVSENELTGTGTALILRPDFDLNIPQVRGVANVSEEVRLEIDFVAVREEADIP